MLQLLIFTKKFSICAPPYMCVLDLFIGGREQMWQVAVGKEVTLTTDSVKCTPSDFTALSTNLTKLIYSSRYFTSGQLNASRLGSLP